MDFTTVSFPKLGLSFNLSQVAFTLFGFEVYWYALIIAAAVVAAVAFGLVKAKSVGLDSDKVVDVIIVGIIGGIIGARLYYVLFNLDEYKNNLLAVFDTRKGGLAIYGGLIFAVLAGLLMCKIRKVKMAPMLDLAGLGFLLGQGIGRWGNFVNVEAFGSPTTLPWGMSANPITHELSKSYPLAADSVIMAHPTFLYESLWCILGFVLLNLYFKHRKFDGQIFLMYGVWYGVERFFVEGLRMDSLLIGPFRVSQLVSALLVIGCIAAMLIIFVMQKEKAPVLYVNTDESVKLLEDKKNRKKKSNSDDLSDGGESDCIDENNEQEKDTDSLDIEPDENDDAKVEENE